MKTKQVSFTYSEMLMAFGSLFLIVVGITLVFFH